MLSRPHFHLLIVPISVYPLRIYFFLFTFSYGEKLPLMKNQGSGLIAISSKELKPTIDMLKEYLRQKIKNEDDSYHFLINRQYYSHNLHHVIHRNWHTSRVWAIFRTYIYYKHCCQKIGFLYQAKTYY